MCLMIENLDSGFSQEPQCAMMTAHQPAVSCTCTSTRFGIDVAAVRLGLHHVLPLTASSDTLQLAISMCVCWCLWCMRKLGMAPSAEWDIHMDVRLCKRLQLVLLS